jgi:hypothetical protein
MDGGSHGLAPMLLRMAIGLNGCPFGRRAQLNVRLLSQAHRTAWATYKQILSDCWHKLAGQTVEIPDWDPDNGSGL